MGGQIYGSVEPILCQTFLEVTLKQHFSMFKLSVLKFYNTTRSYQGNMEKKIILGRKT